MKQVHDTPHSSLTAEQQTLLEDTWKAFIKGGANLQGKDRQRFREISQELSRLSLQFEENTLAETNGFTLHLTEEKDLSGLPEDTIEAAAMAAEEKKLPGWLFTLHAPSYLPFLKYADNRKLAVENRSARPHAEKVPHEDMRKLVGAALLIGVLRNRS